MCTLVLALSLSLAPAASTPVPASEPLIAPLRAPSARHLVAADDDPPDKREDVKLMLQQLAKHAKQKGKEDADAVAVIDQLYQVFPECGPKDRKAIVKGLRSTFDQKRKPDDEGVWDNTLWMAAAQAMADMGPESVKPLMDLIGHKKHRDNVPLQRRLILALGKTRDTSAQKTLTDLLDHPDAVLQGAAAEAIGEFEGADLELRKDFFNELLKLIMSVKSKVDADPLDQIARDRYNVIAGPIITSLQRLSGHDERDPDEWQRWWNKNKKEDWGA